MFWLVGGSVWVMVVVVDILADLCRSETFWGEANGEDFGFAGLWYDIGFSKSLGSKLRLSLHLRPVPSALMQALYD